MSNLCTVCNHSHAYLPTVLCSAAHTHFLPTLLYSGGLPGHALYVARISSMLPPACCTCAAEVQAIFQQLGFGALPSDVSIQPCVVEPSVC